LTVEPRLRLPAATVELLKVRVSVDDDTLDPTAYPVEYAYTDPGTVPAELDWTAGDWMVGGPPYHALVPTPGVVDTLRLWIRVLAGSETPVRLVGIVESFG
jgi:hypothetical protein